MNQSDLYSDYSEEILGKLWEIAILRKAIEPILRQEIRLYHQITKNPDTHESLHRFYSHFEPLLARSASNYIEEKGAIHGLDMPYSGSFPVSEAESVVIFKGTTDLAHFDVLASQLSAVSIRERNKLMLILIDYPPQSVNMYKSLLGMDNVMCVGEPTAPLKKRYNICASIAFNQPNVRSISFWGIPFGMIFISKILKDGFGRKDIKVRYMTLKHKYSFNPRYVDELVNGAKMLEGYDYVNRKIVNLAPNYYSFELLSDPGMRGGIRGCSDAGKHAINNAREHRNTGGIVIGILARSQKISRMFIEHVEKAIRSLDNSSTTKPKILLCSSDRSPLEFFKHPENVIMAPWSKEYRNYFECLDLFLDTYPFGGGLMLAQAMLRSIPCIVMASDLKVNPSSIHAIVTRGLTKLRALNPRSHSIACRHMIAKDIKGYSLAVTSLITDNRLRNECSEISLELGKHSFLAESEQAQRILAMAYLDLAK